MSIYEASITNPKKQLEFYKDLSEQLQRENKKIKKQLEDMTLCRDIASGHRKEVQDRETILLNQQKEFIRYLKEKEKQFDMIGDPINSGACCGILNKYKEIIGGK